MTATAPPYAVCKECHSLYEAEDDNDLWPRLCGSCAATKTYSLLAELIQACVRPAARAQFIALCRNAKRRGRRGVAPPRKAAPNHAV